jgi:predicted transposase YbfD/YdcC
MEWSVESMHWLLDIHFGEDFCRIQDEDIQQSLNIVRKIALNSVKVYKEKTGSKSPLSKIMFDGLPLTVMP